MAAADAGAPGALAALQSLQIVYCQSWQYDDPPARLAAALGADPAHRRYSEIGGSIPLVLSAEAAEAIVRGDLELGLVVGGEALATVRQLKKSGERPAWSFRPAERRPFPYDIPFNPAEVAHQIFQAYLTFALFGSARRAHLGLGLDDDRKASGERLAALTRVAAADPEHAWFALERSAHEITEPTPANRMVAYPYTKLMTSIMDVDMAAAVLIASNAKADELGVPRDGRVYLRGWGYAEDPLYVAERRDLWRSAAMRVAAAAALADAGVPAEEVAHLDLYSCFASSLGFATDALGLGEGSGPLTVTGGLPYHGGPGSNYATHALAAMTARLRAHPGDLGLVSGVSMHMTRHAYGLWSTTPGPFTPCDRDALASAVARDQEVAPITETGAGPSRVAAYSVLHGSNGAPEWGALVCDLPDASRCYARLDDPGALAETERKELVGRQVRLTPGEDRVNRAELL